MSQQINLDFDAIPKDFDLKAHLAGKRVVPGYGNPGSKIWFIGEAPGKDEDELLKPFVGASGNELKKMVLLAGGNLDDHYRDNVVPYRPPNNKLDALDVPVACFYPMLYEKLTTFKPNTVVALGETALRALCGVTGISKYRGSILSSPLVPGLKVIPTFHPANILREYSNRTIAIADITRAFSEMETRDLNLPQRTYIVKPSFVQAVDILEGLTHEKRVCVDIETRSTRIACIGFSPDPSWGISIPLERKDHSSYWSTTEEATIWQLFSNIICNPSIEKVVQNASFDISFLYFHHLPCTGPIWDTLWMHNLLWPEFEHSLQFLCSIYTREPFYKDDGKLWEPWMDETAFWTYNCKDVCVTIEVFQQLLQELKDKSLLTFYEKHYQRLQYPLLATQLLGFRILESKRRRMRDSWEKKVTKAQQEFNTLIGKEMNVNSPKQMAELLYKDLKFPPQKDHKTGRVTTGENALELIALKTQHKVPHKILEVRGLRKFLSAYLNVTVDPDERIRASFGHTDFGRLKASKFLDSTGTNLQTIPEVGRAFFISD